MPMTFFYNSQIVRLATSSLSCLASTTIALVILCSEGGLASSPYRRIIFGLSCGDILQSLGIFTGPFASPIDTPNAIWAVGNTQSCDTAGFILSLGGSMIPLYTFFLSFYFLLRVKYQMTRLEFAKRVEWKIHAFFILLSMTGAVTKLSTGSYNASRAGSLCVTSAYPLACDTNPEIGECTRGKHAMKLLVAFFYVPSFLSFVGMCICLGMLTQYVYVQESRLTIAMSFQTEEGPRHSIWSKIYCCMRIVEEDATEEVLSRGQRIHRARANLRYFCQETLVQSGLYIGAYFSTYVFLFVWMFMTIAGVTNQQWTFLAISLTWPLGGLFNMLVYTRPKIAILKAINPTYSWMILFFKVVLAGGEVPDEINLNPQVLSVDLSRVEEEDVDDESMFPVFISEGESTSTRA